MNPIQRLRQSVIADLERVCPVTHYWLREYDPKADRELVEPLLKEPRRFGLTLREFDAANALSALADFENRSRAIWSIAYPARDIDTQEIEAGTSEQQDREISARYEVFRRVALVYANAISDPQLIEAFQPGQQTSTKSETAPERNKRISDRCDKLRNEGVKAWLKQVAEEEGVSVTRIKQYRKNHSDTAGTAKPGLMPKASSLLDQMRAASKK